MTKIGKTAMSAIMALSLIGSIFLTNPVNAVAETENYSVIENNIATYVQTDTVKTNVETVDLNDNKVTAGVAAINLDSTEEVKPASVTLAETVSTSSTKQILTTNTKISSALNVRKSANTSSSIVGKLMRGCTAEIVGKKGNWYQIKSGAVKGWVSKSYVYVGKTAENYIKKVNPSYAVVTANTLNVRSKASTSSSIVTVVKKNAKFMVVSKNSSWVKVRITDTVQGYVSAKYVKVTNKPGNAVAISIINKYNNDVKARQTAAKKAAASKTSSSSSSSSTKGKSYAASSSDITLLAALVEYEAGTNYQNCLAVANVVLNRVRSSSYPGSIRGVIYQKGQFGTVTSGALNKFLARGAKSTCLKAVKAALAGTNNIGSRVQFRAIWATSPSKHKNSVVIGDNCFF